jgi:hypothetical protein
MRIQSYASRAAAASKGIDVEHRDVGVEYEVGSGVAAVFLSEGWAVPVGADQRTPRRDQAADRPRPPRKNSCSREVAQMHSAAVFTAKLQLSVAACRTAAPKS